MGDCNPLSEDNIREIRARFRRPRAMQINEEKKHREQYILEYIRRETEQRVNGIQIQQYH